MGRKKNKRIYKESLIGTPTGMDNIEKDNKYIRAKERVEELKKFYSELFSGVSAIGITAAINYYINEWANPWFLWVVFGISVGMVIKAVKLFGLNPFLSKGWEQRKIKEFMEQDEKR